jgi:hypothetical protein
MLERKIEGEIEMDSVASLEVNRRKGDNRRRKVERR